MATTYYVDVLSCTGGATFTVAGNTARFVNTESGASSQVASFEGDSASPADNDAAFFPLKLSNDAGTQTEFARIGWKASDVSAGSEIGSLGFSVIVLGALAEQVYLYPGEFTPTTNAEMQLGNITKGWTGVFGSTGFVLNIANGNAVITHSSGIFTVSTGDLRVTTAGTNAASVVTVGGTQTLTAKTLTAPALTDYISFPATQVPSAGANDLDDYEEGTFTPVATFATPGDLSVVYSTQIGRYVKIGKMVWVSFNIATSTFTFTTAAGAFSLTGFPFNQVNVSTQAMGAMFFSGIKSAGTAFTDITARITQAAATGDLIGSGFSIAPAALQVGNFTTGTQIIVRFQLCYEAAN